MSISVPKGPVYMPCYHIDLSAKKAALGKYDYTEMMRKAAQQTDDGIKYYEPDEYGRVFVDPARPQKAAFEPADASGIPLPDPGSARVPAVDTKAEEKEKAQKKEERKERDEQAQLRQEEQIRIDRLEAMLHTYGMPGYRMDYQSWTLAPDPNYFSDLLAEQRSLAETGGSQLTRQEIETLSDKCDMSRMSSQEYQDLVDYLADKGVIDRPKPLDFDPGERISIRGGTAWIDTAGSSGPADGVVRFLHPYLRQRYEEFLAEEKAAL